MVDTPPPKLIETQHRIRRGIIEFQIPDMEPEWVLYKIRDPKYLDQLADMFQKSGVNFVYIWAKGNEGCTYFDTKVGHKHLSLGKMDFVKEMTKRFHDRGIKVGAYFNLSRDKRMFWIRPDWRQVWNDGNDRGLLDRQNPDHDNMCHNSPYGEYIYALLRELTATQDIDSYWIDRLDLGGILPERFSCACPYCNQQFKEEMGADIPKEVDWNSPLWRKYVLWRTRQITNHLANIKNAIKSQKDYVETRLNYFAELDMFGGWFHGQDIEEVLDLSDGASPEIHAEREGTIALSLACKLMRAASGGKPYELVVFRHWGDIDYGFKPLPQLMAEFLTAFSNGGGVMLDDHVFSEGTLEPWTYPNRAAPAFAEIEKREEWFFDTVPIKNVAVFYSKYTRWFYGKGADHQNRYLHSFLGACKALIESQIQFDIVTDRGMNAKDLSGYRVLILPNAVCLNDEQLRVIKEYVRKGGGLIATHRTSLSTEFGDPRGDFGLGDVFHAKYVQPLVYRLSYMKLRDGPIAKGLPVGTPLVCRDNQVLVEPTEGATVAAATVFPREGYNKVTTWADPPLEEESQYPALITSQYGGGKVAYFPTRPDSMYAEWGAPEFRKMLINAVAHVSRERAPVEVDSPMSVEVNAYEQLDKNRIVVHLLNFQGRTVKTVPSRFMG